MKVMNNRGITPFAVALIIALVLVIGVGVLVVLKKTRTTSPAAPNPLSTDSGPAPQAGATPPPPLTPVTPPAQPRSTSNPPPAAMHPPTGGPPPSPTIVPPPSKAPPPAVQPSPPPAPPPPPAAKTSNFNLEADDHGFYPSSEIKVAKGSHVKLTFTVRTTNVYYGGLDVRSSKFNTQSIKPGDSATVEFDVEELSFEFKSYWPLSGVLKATGNVVVE